MLGGDLPNLSNGSCIELGKCEHGQRSQIVAQAACVGKES